MKKRFIALLLSIVTLMSLAVPGVAAADDTGLVVTPASATLPKGGSTELTVSALPEGSTPQWQIAAGEVWVDIAGESAATLTLTYAKVASLLRDGVAQLRCVAKLNGETVDESESVAVAVDESAVGVVTGGVAAGTVIRDAYVTQGPYITAPAVSAPAVSTPSFSAGSAASSGTAGAYGFAVGNPDPVAPGSPGYTARNYTATYDLGAVTADTNSEPTLTQYSIVINYVFENGDIVSEPWTATIAAGSSLTATVAHPVVQGYLPYIGEETETSSILTVNVTNIQGPVTYTVVYKPTNVNYTVTHFQQNAENDQYVEVLSEIKQGLTGSTVPEVAKDYSGFTALLYERPAIAADGSTVVEIKYDRNYYLMNFDLDGGYGVEAIYDRFETPIGDIGTPTKPGYTFTGWTLDGTDVTTLPTTMPAENRTYKANWKIGQAGFTVVFWYENANDNEYSVAGTYKPADVQAGTQKSSDEYKDYAFEGRDFKHFTYNSAKAETVTIKGDGSTVLNVYFTRNTYTLTFKGGKQTLTCTKTVHSHSDDCCKYGGTSITHWSHRDSCCELGLSEHSHDSRCYQSSDLTITAKYQADIHTQFPIKVGEKTIWWKVPNGTETYGNSAQQRYLGSIDIMPGENITFEQSGTESGAKIYYYIETVNGAAGDVTHNGKNYKEYKVIDLDYSGQTSLTYREEFHPITGFTQGDSDPYLPVDGKVGMKYNNYLYYTRNSYNLKFYNYNDYVDGKGGSVQYEAPLSSYYFTPDYPENLEKNAYAFVGWYKTAGCYEGSEANLSTMTMPASDVILYALWVPVTHTVEFYLDKEDYEAGTKLSTHPDVTDVPHGEKVAAVPAKPTHPKGDYNFIGWFYVDEMGEEKAFDFANMAVNRDMQVYGKWSSNVLKSYFVYYKIQGTDTEIAKPTTGSALAGESKTFDAKGGSDLYADYQEGYFPVVQSHTMLLDIENDENNVYTFEYVQKEAVPYSVHYLIDNGDGTYTPAILNEDGNEYIKTVSNNRKAVVTENFRVVQGYMPDKYQKRLVVSGAEGAVNEIIFYYVKDEEHAYYKITHYTQNLDGTTYTEYTSSQIVGDIGSYYTGTHMDIDGFAYERIEYIEDGQKIPDSAITKDGAKLTNKGLEINLYYVRKDYPYLVRYHEVNTEKQLHEPKTGVTGKYGQVVSENAIDIEDYDLVSATPQNINIRIEELKAGELPQLNVITFYYKEKDVVINYVVDGPAGCGSVSIGQETLQVLSGTANGSTATPNDGFRFIGWYNEAGEQVGTDVKYVPKKVNGKNVAATYTAKFEYDLTDLTIEKIYPKGKDQNQSAKFNVVTKNANGEVTYRTAVVLPNNGEDKNSVTITGLKVGDTVTVTEDNRWTWRYTVSNSCNLCPENEECSKMHNGITASFDLNPNAEQNTVTFTNTRAVSQWLSGANFAVNTYGSTTVVRGYHDPSTPDAPPAATN